MIDMQRLLLMVIVTTTVGQLKAGVVNHGNRHVLLSPDGVQPHNPNVHVLEKDVGDQKEHAQVRHFFVATPSRLTNHHLEHGKELPDGEYLHDVLVAQARNIANVSSCKL